MGCYSSRSTEVTYSREQQRSPQHVRENNTSKGQAQAQQEEEDDDDAFVTMEEATAYVMHELEMTSERALRLVTSVDPSQKGRVSSVELVILNEKIKEIKEYLGPKFQEQDPGKQGYVTPTDALVIMKTEFPGMPDTYLQAIVTRFDVDNNSKVDFYEFVEFYAFVKAKRGELESQFRQLDTDHSGDLDADELADTLMNECALTELQARTLVDDFDINRNGKLDKEEFMDMWIKLFA